MHRPFHSRVQLLKDLSYELHLGSTILDFGCGVGATVSALREDGYNAYGCDIILRSEVEVALGSANLIRLIPQNPYRIPFDDNTFDLLISYQVLEHVQNFEAVFSEFFRVLKPGGAGLHIFPPRYILVEPHIYVPLAGVIQRRWWLAIWAYLGIRNSFQKGLSAKTVIERNFDFLQTKTNYLTKNQIAYSVGQFFQEYKFSELLALKNSSKSFLYPFFKYIPFSSAVLSGLMSRVLFIRKTP